MGKVSGGAGRARGRPGAPVAAAAPEAPSASTEPLLGPSRARVHEDGANYSFVTASGKLVQLNILDLGEFATVDFSINGSHTRGAVPPNEANAVAMRLMRHMRENARSKPNGYRYGVNAATGDNFGIERSMAYQAVGLSRPVRARLGQAQYGVVQDGKIRPYNDRLRQVEGRSFEEYNQEWATIVQGTRNSRRR